MSPVEVVLQFLDRINQHEADKLAELMTPEHVFIDSLGQSVRGREKMRTGWQSYFAFCPDYWVAHEEIFQHGDLVAVFGAAGARLQRMESFPQRTNGEQHRRGWRPWTGSKCGNEECTPIISSYTTSWREPRPHWGKRRGYVASLGAATLVVHNRAEFPLASIKYTFRSE
jgi:hypothetical protein